MAVEQKNRVDEELNNAGAEQAVSGDGPPEAAAAELSVMDGLRQELEVLRQQAGDNLDKALRAQAEMENLRKRTARDIENAHKYALERFVNELLPVLDSLELGIEVATASGDFAGLHEGMNLTLRKFQDTLAKFGVTSINPQGEKFSPEKHEAVSMQEQPGSEPGTVVAVMQKGYELNGRLVRPAMVVVAR